MKIVAWIVMGASCLFWIAFARRWSKSIGEYFDSPKYDLPDEITVEIVKEKPNYPAKPSASQTELSAQLSSAEENPSSVGSSRPTGKGGYLPE